MSKELTEDQITDSIDVFSKKIFELLFQDMPKNTDSVDGYTIASAALVDVLSKITVITVANTTEDGPNKNKDIEDNVGEVRKALVNSLSEALNYNLDLVLDSKKIDKNNDPTWN